jgi:uncharacterized protein (DUF1501 family)
MAQGDIHSMIDGSECGDYRHGQLNRRHLLSVGGAAWLGLHWSQLLHADDAKRNRARAKAVIFLHQFGGPSHLDTFDPKPNTPDAIRGEFTPIATRIPGITISERLPAMARVADKFALIRSVHHGMKSHNPATYYSLTGHAPPLDDIRLRDTPDLFPAYGSVVDRLAPNKNGMPTFVAYPYLLRDGSITPGQHGSFLGKAYNPLFFDRDPNGSDFQLPELSLPANLPLARLENRRQVLKWIDRQGEMLEISATARGVDAFYDKALTMLTSPRMKKAFDLGAEPVSLRDRYGRTTYGQGCLLARRLVEAGAKFVNVYFSNSIGGGSTTRGGWDTHGFRGNPMYPILKQWLLPQTDQAVPALLDDLDQRGLLAETVVLWMGEFGRSPRINNMAGRDHWPQCYTVLMAGGGIRGGMVFGSSDKNGGFPATDPVRPDDLAATLFYLLGIDPKTEVVDSLNRPLPISRGEPIMGLLG